MVLIDLYDREKFVDTFCERFNLYKYRYTAAVKRASKIEKNKILYFLYMNKIEVKLDKVDINDLVFVCKHYAYTPNGIDTYKEFGLLNTCDALTLETPLRSFIRERGVRVDVKHEKFGYKHHRAMMQAYDTHCYGTCILRDQGKCKIFDLDPFYYEAFSFRTQYCPYNQTLRELVHRLYREKGSIGVYLSLDIDNRTYLKEVKQRPQILETIDKAVNKCFKKEVGLEKAWRDIKKERSYRVCFDASIHELIGIKEKTYAYNFSYELYKDYLSDDFDPDRDMDIVNTNLFLWEMFIMIYAGEKPTITASLFPGTNVSATRLRYEEYDFFTDEIIEEKKETNSYSRNYLL